MEYDYVIVGGGPAGSVLASRLSENPHYRVCLLEAGGSDDRLLINVPFGFAATVPTKIFNWAFETIPQAGLNNRRGYQPRGKVLGGSSSINAQVYIRGHRSDYDRWEKMGNPGWSYADVLPYFKRAENNETLIDEFHGQGGAHNVAEVRSPNPFLARLLTSAKDKGFQLNRDFNGAEQDGLGWYQVNQKDGLRCNVARAYLTPARLRPNLMVITGAHAMKILLQNKEAVGVEYRRGCATVQARAMREVIICSGALQSPQLLMLSGIGPENELGKFGISMTHNLPGVGRNLQDHIDCSLSYRAKDASLIGWTFKNIAGGLPAASEYRKNRTGLYSSNIAQAGGFLRTLPGLDYPDVQFHFEPTMMEDHGRKIILGNGYCGHVCVLRPKSIGHVGLASSNPLQAPMINPNFLSDPCDMETLVRGMKILRTILESVAPGAKQVQLLHQESLDSDDDIRSYIRRRADTIYHPAGTCKMGADPLAVVDAQLRVHGVHRLRVADASIMPSLIGGNTTAPVVMIAEKAADMIRQGR